MPYIDAKVGYILFASVLSWLLSQLFKFLFNCYRTHSLDWRLLLFGQGGMPSSHTAFVTTLSLGMLVQEGLSTLTLVASAYAIITIRDAVGVRYEVGSHAKALNSLPANIQGGAAALNADFEESVGHNPIEVAAGIGVGVFSIVLTSLVM